MRWRKTHEINKICEYKKAATSCFLYLSLSFELPLYSSLPRSVSFLSISYQVEPNDCVLNSSVNETNSATTQFLYIFNDVRSILIAFVTSFNVFVRSGVKYWLFVAFYLHRSKNMNCWYECFWSNEMAVDWTTLWRGNYLHIKYLTTARKSDDRSMVIFHSPPKFD